MTNYYEIYSQQFGREYVENNEELYTEELKGYYELLAEVEDTSDDILGR